MEANANVPLSLTISAEGYDLWLENIFFHYILCGAVIQWANSSAYIFSTTATKKVEDDGVRIETRANIIDFFLLVRFLFTAKVYTAL